MDLGAEAKCKEMFYHLRQKGEIICIQETHSTHNTQNCWELQWGGDSCFWSHGTSQARGVGILVKKNSRDYSITP